MVVGQYNHDDIMKGLRSSSAVKLNTRKQKLKHRFEIIRKLGEGTCGKVQLGLNRETGQQVAVKSIKKSKIQTDDDLIRIRREIQIMSSVRHPSIIHIFEVFENKDKIVLVMEYAAGGELYDYIVTKRGLSEPDARRIFRQIAAAVYYCHKHKICHRDLKLENVLMDENGNAKIADFGLSNIFDGKNKLTTYCGSPLYASPEVVKGVPYLGPEVDCWSLGVLLYTLVYGAMPFDGSNFKRLVKQITNGEYGEPPEKSEASELIRGMLTPDATKRLTIDEVCSHWWVNEGYDVSCLVVADELARQTPVRLDLLLALAPCPKSSKSLVIDADNEDSSLSLSLASQDEEPPPLSGARGESEEEESVVSESECKKTKKKKKKKSKTGTAEKKPGKIRDKKSPKPSEEPCDEAVALQKDPTITSVAEITDEVADELLEEAGAATDEDVSAAGVEKETGNEGVPAFADDEDNHETDQSITPTPGTAKGASPPDFPRSGATDVRRTLLVPSKTAPAGFGPKLSSAGTEKKSQTDTAFPKAKPQESEEEDEKTAEEELTPVGERGSLGPWPASEERVPQETGARTKKTSVVISLAPATPGIPGSADRTVEEVCGEPSCPVDKGPGSVKSEVRISVGPTPRPRMARGLGPSFDIDDEQEKAAALAEALGVATKQNRAVVARTETQTRLGQEFRVTQQSRVSLDVGRPRPALQHSPREFIIPIALEEGGYVSTPTSSTSSVAESGRETPKDDKPGYFTVSSVVEYPGRRVVSTTSVKSSSSTASLTESGARVIRRIEGGHGGAFSLPPTPLSSGSGHPFFEPSTASAGDMIGRMRRMMHGDLEFGGAGDDETVGTPGSGVFGVRAKTSLPSGFSSATLPSPRYRRYGSAWSGSALDGNEGAAGHQTRSFVQSRPATSRYKVTVQKSGSVSSTDDEDDDFELLSADSLFNSMLSRVKAVSRSWREQQQTQLRDRDFQRMGSLPRDENDDDDWFTRPMSSFFDSDPFGRRDIGSAEASSTASVRRTVAGSRMAGSSFGMSQRARSLLSSMWDDDEWSDFFRT